jgi:transposase InsO family protein
LKNSSSSRELEAENAIGDAFTDYNRKRIHSALGYKTLYELLSEWRMLNK